MKDPSTGFDRRIKMEFRIHPSELRLIADGLERGITVCLNWYHTQIVFINETDESSYLPVPSNLDNVERIFSHRIIQEWFHELCPEKTLCAGSAVDLFSRLSVLPVSALARIESVINDDRMTEQERIIVVSQIIAGVKNG